MNRNSLPGSLEINGPTVTRALLPVAVFFAAAAGAEGLSLRVEPGFSRPDADDKLGVIQNDHLERHSSGVTVNDFTLTPAK